MNGYRKNKLLSDKAYRVFCMCLLVMIIIMSIISFAIGRFSKLNVLDIPKILLHQLIPSVAQTWSATDESILLNLRLPRIIASVIVGA